MFNLLIIQKCYDKTIDFKEKTDRYSEICQMISCMKSQMRESRCVRSFDMS